MGIVRWGQPEWHKSVDSTNRLAAEDPQLGRVIVAWHQSAGRGRRGRQWEAPAGTSLAVTAVVAAAQSTRSWVPLIGGMAVAGALEDLLPGLSPVLKWPNDVLLTEGGQLRKVCGVLAQGLSSEALALGAGLNVHQRRDQLPVETATSVRLAHRTALPDGLESAWLDHYLDHLAALLSQLETAQGAAAVRAAYRQRSQTIGSIVRIELAGQDDVHGVARDIAEDGALIVESTAGQLSHHHAGDVVHVRAHLASEDGRTSG